LVANDELVGEGLGDFSVVLGVGVTLLG